MLKNITRRTWSVLIALVMIWTTFCIGQPLTASASVTTSTPSGLTGVTFVVPEAIYLKPLYNSYYQQTTSTFQWYVNNTVDGAVKTGEDGQGDIYFRYSGATDATIGYEWLSASGQATSGGGITVGGTGLTVGQTKSISSSSNAIKISAGTSPNLNADVTGAYIRWTVTYKDPTDYRYKTVQAYTYVYKPYVEPIGTSIETLNDRGDNHYGGNLSWICGVHDTSVEGDYYPNTGTSKGLMAISSSDSSGSASGSLYAQIPDRFQRTANNDGPQGWLNQDTSSVVPDKSFRHVRNDRDGYSSGDVAFNTRVYSPTGYLTIDISRYTNLNQIPNLTIGLMVTDDESSDSGASYFVANYTGSPMTADDRDYNKSWTHAQEIWDQYNDQNIWSDGGTPSTHNASEAEGVKYNGKWPKDISGTGETTYYVGTGYFNHQGSDTIWNVGELRMKVNRINKANLRAAVKNAINKTPTMQAMFYNISSSEWTTYVNLYKAAAMGLTKLDGSFSVSANGTSYTNPDTLATALNNAVKALVDSASGRLTSRKATQTNIVLRKVGENSYVYAPFLNGTTTRTATFSTYDTVTFTADSVAGYTFIGLKRAGSAPSQPTNNTPADYPTDFTTSDTGATISGSTVKYIHTDTSGTDTQGNIYYTYYYIANTYSVHFDANGGTGTMADQSFTYNVAQNLTSNAFTRQGYSFDGWAKSASGSKVFSDGQEVTNQSTAQNGVVNLYALWKTVNYTILYDTAGGSITGDYVSTYKITDSITLPGATKNGYSLSGWRADDTGNWSTMTYTAGTTVQQGKYGNVKLTAVWKSNNYSVAFNPNGGSGAAMSNQSFVYGTEQALTANAYSRDGFTFRGWALTDTASDPQFADKERVNNLTTEANAVVTLYAVWGTNTYTIVYTTDSGTIRDTSYTRTYTVNDQIGLPTNVEKTGYQFAGWKPASTVGTWVDTVYTGTLSAGMIGNVTLQAQWTLLEYTITYEYDAVNFGEIVGARYTTTYDITKSITLPSAKKIGYGFNGWLSNGGGNWGVSTYSAGNISAGRYGDVTMTAQFSGNQYYVQFNGNNSTSGTMYNQSFTYGEQTALNPNEYSRNGYEFKGWATSSTATSANYPDQGLVSNLSPTAGATVTLYAFWQKISYTIAYDPAGGSITTTGMTTYTITDPIRLPVVERRGYSLLGWMPTAENGSWHMYDSFTGTTIAAGNYGSITLEAHWSKNTYTITYDAQGGTMSGTYTSTYDVDTTIILPSIDRTGYNFGGWLANAAWNNMIVTQDTIPANRQGNVTLTAQWTKKIYYVRFNANGGSGVMNDILMRFDESQTIPHCDFARDGYSFNGWAMTEDGTSAFFEGDPIINLTQVDGATVNFYATWKARSFTIVYDLNGADGSLMSTNNVVMDGAAKSLRAYNVEETVINQKRYAFLGWSYTLTGAQNGVVDYENRASFQMNDEVLSLAEINWSASTPTVTLFAVWQELEIKLIVPEGAPTVIDPDRHFIYGLKDGITQNQLTTEYLGVIGSGTLVVDGVGAPGTGTKVRLVNNDTNATIAEYEIVIFGDINGDGLINSTDYTAMRKIAAGLETVTFNTAKGYACDLFPDGDIGPTDLTMMRAISSSDYEYDQVNRTYG